jgi:hypothetical protein
VDVYSEVYLVHCVYAICCFLLDSAALDCFRDLVLCSRSESVSELLPKRSGFQRTKRANFHYEIRTKQMPFERAFITLVLAVDLDMVPGVCDNPKDFVTLLERDIKSAVPHYNPEVTVLKTEVKKYTWDEKTGKQTQPKFVDDVRLPKVGDKTFDLEYGDGVINVVNTKDKEVNIGFADNCCIYLQFSELTWVESEKRWEYGDLDRK